MSRAQRLQRLEAAEQERMNYALAERIAERHGVLVAEVVHRAQEIGARIERWGLDAGLRRFAREFGLSEAEARARYEGALTDYETAE